MTKISRLISASLLATAFMLGGCGSSAETETSEPETTGMVSSAIGAATGRKVSAANLPPFAKLYPDASVIANMNTKSSDQLSGTVSYSSKAGISDLVDFYKKSFAENGLEVRAEADSGGSYLLSGVDEARNYQLNVTIIPNDEENQRMVMLVHAVPNPAKAAEPE